MIPKECKRLAEVDFPIAEVSRHAAREKSIRHGHPSTLHLWWARRPLASSRAVLLALLWPDPCDPLCPEGFKQKARELLPQVQGKVGPTDEDLRKALLKFIGDFANWDLAANRNYLEVSRALVKAAHLPALSADRHGGRQAAYEPPLVVDPFAGGGSIPLEALRLGCEAFASDLNPVACLILKVMLEDIPRHACLSADRGHSLAEELRRVGAEIKRQAEKELADLYPCLPAGRRRTPPTPEPGKFYAYVLKCSDGSFYKGHTDNLERRFKEHEGGMVDWTSTRLPVDLWYFEAFTGRDAAIARENYFKSGSGREWLERKFQEIEEQPIAYLWARTVRCESPNCGAEIPLARSLWLCKKANRRRALKHRVVRPAGEPPRVEFEVFIPATEADVVEGFATGGKARCPACSSVLGGQRVRAQLSVERGGASPRFDASGKRVGGAILIAVVTTSDDSAGRTYRVPDGRDYQGCFRAMQMPDGDSPTEEINPVRPSPNARGLSAVTRFGMATFADLYSCRQLQALCSFARRVSNSRPGGGNEILALAVGRAANAWTSLCRWHQSGEKIEGAFNGQKIPMVWDFAEASPFSGATGGWDGAVEWVAAVVERSASFAPLGQVQQADAAKPVLPDASAAVWFTDPPYYDAVPYADLADFFLVWLKRALPEHRLVDPYTPANPLGPKVQECVWNQSQTDDEGRPKTPAFFERKFSEAAATGRRTLADDGVGCVVFAHKSTDGWEALLTGLIAGGFVVSASWPISTEMAQRTNARGTASLMGSVHLICRPRADDAGVGDWADVLRELPNRVGDWMERLQGEGVRGADLVFACIGPALEIFSRYATVETAEGREVGLPEYLEKVWEVVGRSALAQVLGTAEAKARNGAAGAVEEDARLTALFLWTLQSTTGDGPHPTPLPEGEGEEDEESSDEDDDEEGSSRGKAKAVPALSADRHAGRQGFTLVFDVVRRFAQPLGIDLPKWEGRVIETKKGVVRLLRVAERAKQLFGEDGAHAVAARLEQEAAVGTNPLQGMLFPDMQPGVAPAIRGTVEQVKGRLEARLTSLSDVEATGKMPVPQATTLDRVHATMLLQAGGRTNALRALLKAEQERGPDFLRLANALSALYPKGSEEKRLLDAMLLAVPR